MDIFRRKFFFKRLDAFGDLFILMMRTFLMAAIFACIPPEQGK